MKNQTKESIRQEQSTNGKESQRLLTEGSQSNLNDSISLQKPSGKKVDKNKKIIITKRPPKK